MYRRWCFIVLMLLLHSQVCAQSAYKKGEIIDEIPVQNSSDTFSLYIPTSFNPDKLSAIVFIFDPSGNAHNGVETFVEAAENFNYILVCSNATKNGIPYETNFAATNALFNTIFPYFRIDERQIYAAGFSGGARLASSVATLTNKFQGVIACGAGMAVNNSYDPKQHLFSFLGMVGNRDMNYQEMLNTKQTLDTLGVTNELLIYEGIHSWPPKQQIQRAFEWLELRAYQKKFRTPEKLNIDIFYSKQYRLADSLLKAERYIQSLSEFKHLHASFEYFFDIDSIQKKITTIENSPSYKKARSNYQRYLQLENNWSEKFLTRFQREVFTAGSNDKFNWWKKELKILNKLISGSKIEEEKNAYERVKFLLQGGIYQSSASYATSQDYKRALYCDQLQTIFTPDNAYVYYRLAVSYARNDNFSSMIKNLRKSKELNLKDFQQTQHTPEFSQYKNRKKFLKLYN